MDEMSNISRQPTQVNVNDINRSTLQASEKTSKNDVVKDMEESSIVNNSSKINSKEDVENLVSELNKAVEPMGTNLKFGVDSDNVFYVSVVDSETSKMIRRFPAEQASDFLPKMQEVSGVLFDSKG